MENVFSGIESDFIRFFHYILTIFVSRRKRYRTAKIDLIQKAGTKLLPPNKFGGLEQRVESCRVK